MNKLTGGVLLRLAIGGLALAAGPGATPAKVPSEAERAAQAIERTLQRHGKDVHRCFEKALADRLDVSGKVEIEVDVGEGGKIEQARVVSPEKSSARGLSPCLVASASQWKIEGIEPGVSVVLPFAFEGQMNQYVVKAADAPDRGPGANKAKDDKPRPTPPFTVKVLADPVNVRAQQMSLTLLSVGPASRVAMHRHPKSAKVLYLLKGHARLLGPTGTQPTKVEEGTAVFIPAAYPHVIENMGRTSTAVFLQAFAPPGPERVYRDPKDPQGRTDFEVIRDPGRAKAPPAANGKLVARDAGDVSALPVPGAKGTARILLDPQFTGSQAMAVSVVEFQPGTEIARHQHAGSSEVLYVVAGGGTLSVGSESYPFGTDEVIHIPADQPHGGKVAGGDKLVAIQFYAPAGPEQRFRAAPGKSADKK